MKYGYLLTWALGEFWSNFKTTVKLLAMVLLFSGVVLGGAVLFTCSPHILFIPIALLFWAAAAAAVGVYIEWDIAPPEPPTPTVSAPYKTRKNQHDQARLEWETAVSKSRQGKREKLTILGIKVPWS